MADSHVVSASVSKRAEIAGMIARTQQQLGQFRADLVYLDATIRLFASRNGAGDDRAVCSMRSAGAGAPIRAPDLVRDVMIDTSAR